MDDLDDGSASPESADENLTDLPPSEDQVFSKNRSKRKPSKTQIKHIAQGEFGPPVMNGQTPGGVGGTRTNSSNTHNPPNERKKVSTSKNVKYDTLVPKFGDNNIDDMQGLYEAANTQLQSPRAARRVKWSPKVVKQNASPQSSSAAQHASFLNSSLSSLDQSQTMNTSPRSASGRPSPCYPCAICGKVFRVPSRFDSHMLGHSKGKPFCCNTCGKMFASQEKLDRHLPVHNCDRRAAFTCETCGKVCVNWRAYLYHMKAKHTESGGKRFSCNLCGRQFHSGQRLRNHMASHEVGKNHCCHVCGKLFESHKKLAIHSLVHNLSSMHDQNLQCVDCGRQYTEWIAFKQHMKTHGTEGVHYPCGICGETFTTQYEKEKHKRVHKQVQCGVCNRYFRSSSVLSVHLRIHTGEKPYKCGLCDKEFSQLSVMKIHMRIHIKDGRYDCKICTAIFTDVMDYFKHYVAHFEDGNLQCEICGKLFDNIKKKNRHMAAHQDRTGRQCHICGKEFGRVSHLEAHMLCHSDNAPIMCKICGKMFSSDEVLTAHYTLHIKPDMNDSEVLTESPLFCGLCGKMFKDQEYLDKHMKRHEDISSVTTNISRTIKSEDVMLDEDIVEVLNGHFQCKECGKTFGQEDHLVVHSREHTGLKPHICVMCGQSFMLRKLLFEHGLTHRSKDLINHTPIQQGKSESISNVRYNRSSSGKHNIDSDSGSSSETDTDCDHEENVRQSKGKQPQVINEKEPSSSSSSPPLPSSSSEINHPYDSSVSDENRPSATAYSSQQSYSLPHIGTSKVPSSSYISSSVSSSSSTSLRNRNDAHAAGHQMQDQFSYRDQAINSQNNNPIPQTMHTSFDAKNAGHNTQHMNMSRPEIQMPVEMHMSSSHQDFKTDVKEDPVFGVQKTDPNASYTCTTCQKVCVNWRAYVYHQRSRHSETDGRRFSCDLCGRQFYTRHRLKKHTLGHEKGKHHCCHICGKLFENSKKLNIHSLVHNLSSMHHQDLQCSDCGRRYTDWVPFKQHMKTHGAEGICYPCGICEEAFPTQYELEKHRRVHKQFQCEFCERYFRSASVLSVHLRVHTGERPYKCGLCERDFSQSCVLKVHMRTHAKEGKYECKLCGLVFQDVMEYFKHHMAHLEEGNLQCEECGKFFDDINNKNRHMASHRERDGRQCHVCGKEFGRVSHLEAHMLSHSDSDPLPLTCKVCGKSFLSQSLLTVHYASHMTGDLSSTDAALSTADGIPIFCGVCGKMFKDREYLQKHMRKHDKETEKSIKVEKFIDEDVVKVENGQFPCNDCGKRFGKADHLVVHRREHTGECPHSCCMCGKSFMLRTQLLQHIREHRQSNVMMYLNLNDGEVCATMSDIKDVLQFNMEDSDSGTETDMYHNNEGMRTTKATSNHSEPHKQLQPMESQNEAELHPNQPELVKPDIIHQKLQHSCQIPKQQQKQDQNHRHHHSSPVTSDQMSSGPMSISISSSTHSTSTTSNLTVTSTSMTQQKLPPISHEKDTLMSFPHDSRYLFSEAIPPTYSLSVSHGHNAHSSRNDLSSSKGDAYLYHSHDLSNHLTRSDVIPSESQISLSDNKTPMQHNNIQMLRSEPHMPIAVHNSQNHQNLKTNSSHPLVYPRTYNSGPTSLASYIHGHSNKLNTDVPHTLSNFELLPQTAFPENAHHM